MVRLFEASARMLRSNIEAIKEDLEEMEKLFLEVNKEPLTEDYINHYAHVYGFDSDEYTLEEKRLLAMDRILYWHYN